MMTADPSQPLPEPQATVTDATMAPAQRDRRPRAFETQRLYAADWAAFAKWCCRARHTALPAAPATVATYLGSLTTLQHGALARRAAAIADQHRQRGHPSPGADDSVRAVLRAARRARSAERCANPDGPRPPVRRREAPSAEKLVRMAARCPGDLAGLRDRALLLLTAAGIGGERLLALDCEHVRLTGLGVELAVPGVGGGESHVAVLARLRPHPACPVRALEHWLHSSDTRFGPVFRKVDRWGGVEHRRLRADALSRIFRRRASGVRQAA